MRPRTTRALIVLAVFALLAVLSAANSYLEHVGTSSVYGEPAGTWDVLLRELRYYLAWALVAPGIWWLGRRVPILRERWLPAIAFHVAVPVVGCVPFWWSRILLNAALGAGWPLPGFLATTQWGLLFVRQALFVLPTYWLLLGLGAAVQVMRSHAANEIRAATLQRSLAAAQLDSLRMKAQPHLLFNTLDAIAALGREGDTDAVVRVIERLGVLLHLSMETSGRQVVRLEEELALLDEYLAIEQIRLKDRLRIVRRIAPEVQNALVPNLILQPLVEHALLGGGARRLEAGLLEIAAHRDADMLRIAMRNIGSGLPPDGNPSSTAGEGLKNVVERLDALYAGHSRIELAADAAGRSRVLLSLPFSATELRSA